MDQEKRRHIQSPIAKPARKTIAKPSSKFTLQIKQTRSLQKQSLIKTISEEKDLQNIQKVLKRKDYI